MEQTGKRKEIWWAALAPVLVGIAVVVLLQLTGGRLYPEFAKPTRQLVALVLVGLPFIWGGVLQLGMRRSWDPYRGKWMQDGLLFLFGGVLWIGYIGYLLLAGR